MAQVPVTEALARLVFLPCLGDICQAMRVVETERCPFNGELYMYGRHETVLITERLERML